MWKTAIDILMVQDVPLASAVFVIVVGLNEPQFDCAFPIVPPLVGLTQDTVISTTLDSAAPVQFDLQSTSTIVYTKWFVKWKPDHTYQK